MPYRFDSVGLRERAFGLRNLADRLDVTADRIQSLLSSVGRYSGSTAALGGVVDEVEVRAEANEQAIEAWLREGAPLSGSAFTHTLAEPIGSTLVRDAPGLIDAVSVRVVLRAEPSLPGGYRILTAFPEL